MDIYKHINDSRVKSIEDFFDYYINIVSNSIRDAYNKTNSKSYLFIDTSKNIGLVDNIYKKNIFKVDFEIYNKLQTIYFNIDMDNFCSHKTK